MFALVNLVRIVQVLLVIYCVLTWFVPPNSSIMYYLGRIMEPMLGPARRLIRRFTNNPIVLSFAPIVVMVALDILMYLITWLARLL